MTKYEKEKILTEIIAWIIIMASIFYGLNII